MPIRKSVLTFCGAFLLAIACLGATTQRPQRLEIVADDGHHLSVWVERPATRRHGPILLVHGRTWSALPNFDLRVKGHNRSVMDALSARGYAVYALDGRGYGSTPRDMSGWLTPLRAARDIAVVLQWIGAREDNRLPILIGYSRGAVMSLLAAQLYPDRMSKLVLYALVRDIDQKDRTIDGANPARERTTAEMAVSDFVTPAAAPQEVIDAYARQALASDPVRVDWRNEHELNDLDPSKVCVPTLMIRGALDPRATAEKDMKVLSRLGTGDRSLVILPASDHAAHVEDAQAEWVDAIVTFIERPRASK